MNKLNKNDDGFFDFEKHEKMTTKQANIIIAIIVVCFVGLGLVNYFEI